MSHIGVISLPALFYLLALITMCNVDAIAVQDVLSAMVPIITITIHARDTHHSHRNNSTLTEVNSSNNLPAASTTIPACSYFSRSSSSPCSSTLCEHRP
eukprot:3674759-Amphidinium_carterae.1